MSNLKQQIGRLGRLGDLPRISIHPAPTPIERLDRLGQRFNHSLLFVKRDDCHGLAFGGNKVRQLEYYFGDATARGADTILVTGAVQSNFARLTAAFAAKLGMECHIQHENRVADVDDEYLTSGNVLLAKMLGAHLHPYPDGEDEAGADRAMRELAATLRQRGRKPYVIPLAPGHPPYGALGYVLAAAEILEQIKNLGCRFDKILVASGSGNTHAGLLFGLRALNSDVSVIGSCVRRAKSLQFERIRIRCSEIAELLDLDSPIADKDIELCDYHLAPGYGKASGRVLDTISLAAATEALLVDPTYTGKAFATFIDQISHAAHDEGIMFIHTGGTPGLFAYKSKIAEHLQGATAN